MTERMPLADACWDLIRHVGFNSDVRGKVFRMNSATLAALTAERQQSTPPVLIYSVPVQITEFLPYGRIELVERER